MSITRTLATLLLLTGVATAASAATVVNYADLQPFDNYDPVTTHGSNAQVAITTRTFNQDAGLTTFSNRTLLWNAGYSNLPAVTFAETDGRGAEITLTPLTGLAVTLQSFQLGSYLAGTSGIGPDRTAVLLRVIEVGSGNVLWDDSGLIVNSAKTLTPNVSSTAGLSVQWGYDWDIGLNFLTFDVGTPGTTVVPVPPAVALFLGGLGLLGWAGRRRA